MSTGRPNTASRPVDVPTHEVVNGQRVAITDKFRAYNNWADCLQDRAQFFFRNPRYAKCFRETTGPGWARRGRCRLCDRSRLRGLADRHHPLPQPAAVRRPGGDAMTALERSVVGVVLAVLLVAGALLGLRHYGNERYQAGYDAAVAPGKEARYSAETANLAIESGLRAQLLDRDTAALRKEQEYASNLANAQRRMRAGDDRLRCPVASAVQSAAAAADRPAAAGAPADGPEQDLVPEAAADVLGYGAAIAGLVRKYERVIQRFEACRAVNATP